MIDKIQEIKNIANILCKYGIGKSDVMSWSTDIPGIGMLYDDLSVIGKYTINNWMDYTEFGRSENKIKFDVFKGKLAELFVYKILINCGYDISKVDLEKKIGIKTDGGIDFKVYVEDLMIKISVKSSVKSGPGCSSFLMSESVDNFAADVVVVIDYEGIKGYDEAVNLDTLENLIEYFKDIKFTYRGVSAKRRITSELPRENEKKSHFTSLSKMKMLAYNFK